MFELRWDDNEVEAWLEPWQEPKVKRTLRAAATAFGKAGRPILRRHTPSAPPGNIYAIQAGGAGNLQRQTRYKRIRARYGIGVVIAPMGKGAWYRHIVTGGARPHVIRPKTLRGRLRIVGGFATSVQHPGARPNPYVARAAGEVESAGFAAAEQVVFDGLQEARRVVETED